jgi:hypothetical protein
LPGLQVTYASTPTPVKKPKDLLEYVIVQEMAHLIEPTHSDRFIAILEKHYPTWRAARAELNKLPLTAEAWTSEGLNMPLTRSFSRVGAGAGAPRCQIPTGLAR